MNETIKKINRFIVQLIFSVALVFPLGLATLFIARRVLIKEIPNSLIPLLVVVLFFFTLFVLQYKSDGILKKIKYMEHQKTWNILAILFLVGLTILWRIILIIKFQTPQVTEFYIAFDMAKKWISGPAFSPEHLFAPRWGIYTLILSKALMINDSLFMAKFTSVIAAVISVVFIYLSILKSTGKYLLALTSGLILSLWPSFAAYSNFLTPEHFFVMFFSISIYFLIQAISHIKNNVQPFFLYSIFFSVFLSCANSFKDITIISIPASLIIFAYYIFNDKTEIKKKVINFTLIVIILLLSTFLVGKIRNTLVSHYAMGPVNETSTGYFVATGLNIENSGRYNSAIGEPAAQRLRDDLNNNKFNSDTYKQTNQNLINIALNEVKSNYRQLPTLFINKFYTIWSNEDEINNLSYDSYTLTNTTPANMTLVQFKGVLSKLNLISNSYFLLTMIFATLSIIFVLWVKTEVTPDLYLSTLLCLGFAAVLLIIEILTRYRSILYPAITLQATYGIYFLSEYFKKNKKNHKASL